MSLKFVAFDGDVAKIEVAKIVLFLNDKIVNNFLGCFKRGVPCTLSAKLFEAVWGLLSMWSVKHFLDKKVCNFIEYV